MKVGTKRHFLITPESHFVTFLSKPLLPCRLLKVTNYGITETKLFFIHLAAHASLVMSKEAEKLGSFNHSYCPGSLLHIDTHASASYPDKKNKRLPTELGFN